uniref:Uncharacterized protein n=1 Tax=Pipistrellus kuhlii TaxID=59472 RepID=A0A7J7ZG97_PIPKU|nr:hypothetical protein mPipKuh1_001662 [Pipistrellus kuhlii]
MADSSSCNNCADTEDSKSTLSLSVGYYPNEDTFPSKNTASCEDTSSHNPSIHFVPESIGRLMERQDQIQASTEQFGKLGIPLAWDGANPSDSIVNWDPYGESLWIDPEEKTKLTLSKLHRLEQFLENQKDEEDDEFIFPEFAQKEYFQLPSSTPPHVAQTIGQATGRQRTSTIETCSISSDKSKKEDTHSSTQPLSFFNFRWVFRWLRQRVLSSFGGRGHPKKAPENPHKLTRRKRLCHRSTKIEPLGPIEGEYPESPSFKTF